MPAFNRVPGTDKDVSVVLAVKNEEIYVESDPGDVLTKKSLMGALALYLDFINLFVLLLQLTGQRRD